MSATQSRAAAWQPLSLSSHLDAAAPRGRMVAGRRYALFRDLAGAPRVLEDRCAHRKAPLSLGRITPEGWLECPYHGWSYSGENGDCLRIPNLASHETIPGKYCVGHFACAEHDGLIFVWDGPAAGADRSLLPDCPVPPGTARGEGESLITLPWTNLVATLLDAPSLLLDIPRVTLIDAHPLGEPVEEGGRLVVERAADWTSTARRRRRTPAEYPLALRVALTLDGRAAVIALREPGANRVLLSAALHMAPVSDCVSALYWRWSATPPGGKAAAAAGKLAFSLRPGVDPAAMVAVHPYVSSVFAGRIPWALTRPGVAAR